MDEVTKLVTCRFIFGMMSYNPRSTTTTGTCIKTSSFFQYPFTLYKMALGKHIDTDKLIAAARDHPIHKHTGKRYVSGQRCSDNRNDLHGIPYASRYEVNAEVPRFKMPEDGVDPKVAYQILHDDLLLGTSHQSSRIH